MNVIEACREAVLQSSSLCRCLSCASPCICVHMCLCVWSLEVNLRCDSLRDGHLGFGDSELTDEANLTRQEPQESFCFCLPSADIASMCHYAQLFSLVRKLIENSIHVCM